jgi:hypothetical protein
MPLIACVAMLPLMTTLLLAASTRQAAVGGRRSCAQPPDGAPSRAPAVGKSAVLMTWHSNKCAWHPGETRTETGLRHWTLERMRLPPLEAGHWKAAPSQAPHWKAARPRRWRPPRRPLEVARPRHWRPAADLLETGRPAVGSRPLRRCSPASSPLERRLHAHLAAGAPPPRRPPLECHARRLFRAAPSSSGSTEKDRGRMGE